MRGPWLQSPETSVDPESRDREADLAMRRVQKVHASLLRGNIQMLGRTEDFPLPLVKQCCAPQLLLVKLI